MPTPKWDARRARDVVGTIEECLREGWPPPDKSRKRKEQSAVYEAARRREVSRQTIDSQLEASTALGIVPDWSLWQGGNKVAKGPSLSAQHISTVKSMLRQGPRPISEVAETIGIGVGALLDLVETIVEQGVNVHRTGETLEIPHAPEPSWTKGVACEVTSTAENRFVVGATGDWHVGSKYYRQDVIDDLYDRFADSGVTDVFHTGNWIDGEASFNKYDLLVHGFDAQCRELSKSLPVRNGITTHAVWGDDHEGWYAQREGVDVGRYAEQIMRSYGRTDWNDIGFMEAHVVLRNANSGKHAMLSVMHPGGGSSYALSYKPQKIIEAFEGGEKPNVLFLGHYHKLDLGIVRNVWYAQTGCGCDQTPFLRKKSIEAHLGGLVIELEQDPDTGAIISMNGMQRYFNKGYYTGARWSHHAPAKQAPRTRGGV